MTICIVLGWWLVPAAITAAASGAARLAISRYYRPTASDRARHYGVASAVASLAWAAWAIA